MQLSEIKEGYPETYKMLLPMVQEETKVNPLLSRILFGAPKTTLVRSSEEVLASLHLRQPIFTICEKVLTKTEKFELTRTETGFDMVDVGTKITFKFKTWCGNAYHRSLTMNGRESELLSACVTVLVGIQEEEEYLRKVEETRLETEQGRRVLIEAYK